MLYGKVAPPLDVIRWDYFCPKCDEKRFYNEAPKMPSSTPTAKNKTLATSWEAFSIKWTPLRLSNHIFVIRHSLLLIGPTGIQYIMYHVYMTWLHHSFYCFIGPFIVQVFGWDVSLVSFSTLPQLDLSLNPVPFAIDVHLSIFACVWGLFWKDLSHTAEKGAVWKKLLCHW